MNVCCIFARKPNPPDQPLANMPRTLMAVVEIPEGKTAEQVYGDYCQSQGLSRKPKLSEYSEAPVIPYQSVHNALQPIQ